MKKPKKIISYVVFTLVVFFILRVFLNNSNQALESIRKISWQYQLLACLLYLGYFYSRAIVWNFVLRALGYKLKFRQSLYIWFIGESTRYIPGNIWSYITKTYLAKSVQIPKSIIATSFLVEIWLILTVTTFLSSLFFFNNPNYLKTELLILPVILILLVIARFFLRKKFDLFLNGLESIFSSNESRKIILLALAFQFLAWTLYSIGTFIIMQDIAKLSNPLFFISMGVFAWLLGYLSFITPTGFGVREGILIIFLSNFVNIGEATVIAILARINLLTMEVLNLVFWLKIWQQITPKNTIKFFQNNWDKLILGLLILTYSIIFSKLSILRHQAFASSYDLANMGQTVWNTFHGRFFVLSGAQETVSRFSVHADIILILLSSLYLIWERIRMLLIIQSVVLGLGAIPVFMLTYKILGETKKLSTPIIKAISLLMSIVYLVNPSLEWTNIYDFHGVSFAIPLLLLAFYFSYTKNWGWFAVFTLLALLTKEEISLFIAMLGLTIFFIFKERSIGFITFLVGILWFPLMAFLVIPHFSQSGRYWALDWYQFSNQTTGGYSTFPSITDLIQKFFLASDVKDYYLNLLKPFAFLPILGLPWLLLSLPELTINILSSQAQMRTTIFHYDSGITPALVISTIFGLKYLYLGLRFIKPLARYSQLILGFVSLCLLGTALRVNYHYSPLPTTPSCWCLVYQVTADDEAFEKVLLNIPKDASVTSSSEVRAHLTRRENSFTLPNATESADYIAILDQNRIIGDYSTKEFETKLIKVLLLDKNHLLLNHIGHFYLFKKLSSS